MEKGGQGLFECNANAHQLINDGEMTVFEWRNSVKLLMYKMVTFIHWLHTRMHCCDLDISLENVVLSNRTYFDEKCGKYRNLNLKLAEMFDSQNNLNFNMETASKKGKW